MNVLEISTKKYSLFWVFLTLFLKILNRILRYFEEPLQVIWCYRNFYLEHMHGSIKIWPSQHLYWSVSHEDRRFFLVNWILIRSADITNSSSKSLEFIISQSEIQKKKPEDHCYSPWAPKITSDYSKTRMSITLHLYFYTFTFMWKA